MSVNGNITDADVDVTGAPISPIQTDTKYGKRHEALITSLFVSWVNHVCAGTSSVYLTGEVSGNVTVSVVSTQRTRTTSNPCSDGSKSVLPAAPLCSNISMRAACAHVPHVSVRVCTMQNGITTVFIQGTPSECGRACISNTHRHAHACEHCYA